MTRPTLLIPINFPEPELYPVTDSYVEVLDGFSIVLLGYWERAEQTRAREVRSAQETEAQAVLYEIAAQFSHAGAQTDIELHFGPGGAAKKQLQERVLADRDPDGVLRADRLNSWKNILVPLRDDRHSDELVEILSAFHSNNIFVIELYHVAPDEGAVEDAERMLQRVEASLKARGFTDSDLEVTVEVEADPGAAIARKSRSHNIVLMGETGESAPENRVFGSISNHLVDKTTTPILIVR